MSAMYQHGTTEPEGSHGVPEGVRTPPKVRRPEPAPLVTSSVISALEAALGAADAAGDQIARERELSAFWSAHTATPVCESAVHGERTVTFLWRDEADHPAAEVLLFVNRLTDERDLGRSLMRKVEGTDVWHLSYRMRDDWRASYCFLPRTAGQPWPWRAEDQLSIRRALDRGRSDPRNIEGCVNRAGTQLSVVQLPQAPPQRHLARREGLSARGRTTEYEGPDGNRVWVYLPPRGVDAPASSVLPLVVLFDGEVWAGSQDIATTVDNLIADELMRPCVLVLPETGGRARRWQDLDQDGSGAEWAVTVLLPWVRAHVRAGGVSLSEAPEDVIVAGQSLGAYTALRCALEYPHLVRGVLSQSASLWQRELRTRAPELLQGLRVYLEVGMQEWVLRGPNAELAANLASAGADVHFVEYNGGHDYACWRGGLADGLRVLLGPQDSGNTLGDDANGGVA